MPFAATWMDLKIVILSEVSQTEKEISYDITCMWNLKRNDTDERIYKTEMDSQTYRMILRLPAGEGWRERIGSLGLTCTHCDI